MLITWAGMVMVGRKLSINLFVLYLDLLFFDQGRFFFRMSSDALTTTSRNFYERARGKVVLSIVTAAGGLFALGYCSSAGGYAKSYYDIYDSQVNSDQKDANQAAQAGYGFAAFCFILSFIVFIVAAVYVSPLLCGTVNEKKILKSPQEIDTGYSSYTENPAASGPGKLANQV